MKTPSIKTNSLAAKGWIAASALALLAGPAFADGKVQLAPKVAIRDVLNHGDIVELARKSAVQAQQNLKEANTPVAQEPTGEDPAKNAPVDILKRSELLCYGGLATLVPKGALAHVPKTLAGRIGMQDGAKFVTWPDFFAANRGWITTLEISRKQAEGREPLTEATLKSFAKETRLVVATYAECPITLNVYKAPEGPATAAAP